MARMSTNRKSNPRKKAKKSPSGKRKEALRPAKKIPAQQRAAARRSLSIPDIGETFDVVVRRTILRGRTIFADGKPVDAPRGRLVRPQGT